MKKLFLILLLTLLPLQFAQAAMCAYCCESETSTQPQSTDGHQQGLSASVTDIQAGDDASDMHHDCGICHFACAKVFVSPPTIMSLLEPPSPSTTELVAYQSLAPRGIDRPKWNLAA
jgi:hypothetical protein